MGVHGDRIGKRRPVDVHLPHPGPVEPVEHDDVERIAALPVPVRHRGQLRLRLVARLALDQAERRFGRQRRRAGQLGIARIQIVAGAPGDDEKRHALADVGLQMRLAVQTGRDDRRRRIVPQDRIAFVRHHERHAHRFAGGAIVIVAAVDRPPAQVEHAVLILAQAVVVRVRHVGEGRADAERMLARHVVRRHLPPGHRGQRRAVGTVEADRHGREGRSEIAFHLARRLGPGLRRHRDAQVARGEDVAAVAPPLSGPARGIAFAGNAIAGLAFRLASIRRDRHAHDPRSVGLHRHQRPMARDGRQSLCIGRRAAGQQRGDQGEALHRPAPRSPSARRIAASATGRIAA